ncbi:MAG: PKD domain-containing protein [Thermoanaerobaculaceae bacterium]|nr:PKD domain-containing protein [Thermoanaerobaculaceae bacterium]
MLPLGAAGLEIVVYRPTSPQAGQEVTFRFSPEVLHEGDSVSFSFGDGGTATVLYTLGCGLFGGCAEVKHTYAGAGVFTVSGTGTISGNPVSGSVQVTVTAGPEDPDVFVATGAHQIGYNNTVWRTDLEVHNPGAATVTYRIALLKRDTDNRSPQTVEFTLKSGRSAHHPDVLLDPFGFEGAAALRVTPVDGALVIHSRTYNELALGSYGQFVPGMSRAQAVVSGQQARLIGLFHEPSLAAGFRTNFGLVNASSAPISVEVSFRRSTGGSIGTRVYDLKALEFKQINKVFEEVTSEPIAAGVLLVKVTTTGARLYAYASMVDNVTGDGIFIPAVVTP